MDDKLLAELHRRSRLGLDAMAVIELVSEQRSRYEVRPALEAILDGVDLPANVRNPLRAVLDHFGLLEGIQRHVKPRS
jgi:hypothetical protein